MSSFRRRMMMAANAGGSTDTIIMTNESNPEVLAICYAQRWCANANYMTASEAAVVTSIGTVFRGKTITHFDEFRYFTGLTAIGIQAFQDCQNLVSIELPSTITTIGKYAFFKCYALQKIVIPSSVTSIGVSALRQCTSLTSIYSLATTAPTITDDVFYLINSSGTLYVPSGATGYDVWMGTGNYYLGKYNWTKVEQ